MAEEIVPQLASGQRKRGTSRTREEGVVILNTSPLKQSEGKISGTGTAAGTGIGTGTGKGADLSLFDNDNGRGIRIPSVQRKKVMTITGSQAKQTGNEVPSGGTTTGTTGTEIGKDIAKDIGKNTGKQEGKENMEVSQNQMQASQNQMQGNAGTRNIQLKVPSLDYHRHREGSSASGSAELDNSFTSDRPIKTYNSNNSVAASGASGSLHPSIMKTPYNPYTPYAPYAPSGDQLADQTVDCDTVALWLRRARRKLREGLSVIRITHAGKLTRRQIYVNAKPGYMELISTKLFDIAYPLCNIIEVVHGLDSPDFEKFRELEPVRVPKASRSLVIRIKDEPRPISLVFPTESDRRDTQFLLRMERLRPMNVYRPGLNSTVTAIGGSTVTGIGGSVLDIPRTNQSSVAGTM